MPHRLVYLIGQPGSGKSTVAEHVTRGWWPLYVNDPIPHQAWRDEEGEFRLVTLGRPRANFNGTDTLAMNIQPRAIDWLVGRHRHAPRPNLVFAEGDRLANIGFFDALAGAGWEIVLLWLDTPDDVAAQRRSERGSAQSEAWLRGRRTKIRRLVERCPVTRLDGLASPSDLAAEVRTFLQL